MRRGLPTIEDTPFNIYLRPETFQLVRKYPTQLNSTVTKTEKNKLDEINREEYAVTRFRFNQFSTDFDIDVGSLLGFSELVSSGIFFDFRL